MQKLRKYVSKKK